MHRSGVSIAVIALDGVVSLALLGGCSSAPEASASVSQPLDEAWTAPRVNDRPGVVELLGPPLAFKVTFEEVEGSSFASSRGSIPS